LRSIFEEVGDVKNISLKTGPDGTSKGMGTVEYIAEASAQRAYFELHERVVGGLEMIVDEYETGLAASSSNAPPAVDVQHNKSVYFENVAASTSEAKLRSVFETMMSVLERL